MSRKPLTPKLPAHGARASRGIHIFGSSASKNEEIGHHIREEINYQLPRLQLYLNQLARKLHSPLTPGVTFAHQLHAREANGQTWAGLYGSLEPAARKSARVLISLDSIKRSDEANSPSEASHIVGVNFGKLFAISQGGSVCDLALTLKSPQKSIRNLLFDIATDIFLFRHHLVLALGYGRNVEVSAEGKRAFSHEKIRYAREKNLSFYGRPAAGMDFEKVSYLPLAGCSRQSEVDAADRTDEIVENFRVFFQDFYEVTALGKPRKSKDQLLRTALSLRGVGGQLSQKNLERDFEILSRSGKKEILLCFLRKVPDRGTLRTSIANFFNVRSCRAALHRLASESDLAQVISYFPFVSVVKLQQTTK